MPTVQVFLDINERLYVTIPGGQLVTIAIERRGGEERPTFNVTIPQASEFDCGVEVIDDAKWPGEERFVSRVVVPVAAKT